MKKIVAITGFLLVILIPPKEGKAQDPITEVIKAAVIKVVKAVDLQIQRVQNKTIWLQNAQKTLENAMSKMKLEEISTWTQKQRTLYKDYYEELYKVKAVITYYQRIKEVSSKQVQLMREYERAWGLFKQDKHFTPNELAYMASVYSGILEESAKNMDGILLVIRSFTTQMSDAGRLEIINKAADEAEANYNDLKAFNGENIKLSLQRAKAQHDVDVVRKLYGIQ